MEPVQRDDPERRIVAVFPDAHTARTAADAVRRASLSGVSVEIDDHSDELAAIRGEMHDEMSHTIVGPGNIGPFTKEMTKGIVAGVGIATVIGALVALPLALIPLGDVSFGLRLLIAASVGAVAGALYGFFAGGAGKWETDVAGRDLATERGVTVGVWVRGNDAMQRAGDILAHHQPIRVDQVTQEGAALRTVATEEDDPA